MPDMLGQAWSLSDSVSLRPEPFGALAYDFRTRRLSFLKTPALVEVVRRLGDCPSVADALASAGVDASEHASYARALRTLADSGILTPRTHPEEILV
ncbi:MAG: mycofactocin biosynthesis chaperone MftB [Actinomycetota bacterium]|nr:mycofactocin biosynthesis chaperone MftB [Actinomycetota bacterium]